MRPTETAKKLCLRNRDKLEVIAKALLEYETLDGVRRSKKLSSTAG